MRDPTALGSSSNGLGLKVEGWNILYNLGYMYNDGKKVYDNTRSSVTTDLYEETGEYVGDFLMRFFWSRYVPRDY